MTLAEALLATHTRYDRWAAGKRQDNSQIAVMQMRGESLMWSVWWDRVIMPEFCRTLHEVELILAFCVITSPRTGWYPICPIGDRGKYAWREADVP